MTYCTGQYFKINTVIKHLAYLISKESEALQLRYNVIILFFLCPHVTSVTIHSVENKHCYKTLYFWYFSPSERRH